MKNNKSNKFSYCLQILLALSALSACRSHDDTETTALYKSSKSSNMAAVTITLENTTILEKGSNVGETFSFQIDKSDFDANKRFEWKIVSSPEGVVTPQILVDATTTTMSFVPSVRGTYEIQVSDGVIKRDFTAVANYEAPFNQGKIHKDSASAKSFSVVNQFVFRTNLNEKDIIDIINKYPKIKFIDLYKTKLLIEVDDEIDIETMEQLELLKLEKSVRYIGERNFFKDLTSQYVPNDGSDFDDMGDNWYLEDIKATQAWDITRGSIDISIGVIDGGITEKHEEIKGKVSTISNSSDEGFIHHGTAVSSIIAGRTNNKKGVSGLNHESNIKFMSFSGGNVSDKMNKLCSNKTKLVNLSIGINWGEYWDVKDIVGEYIPDLSNVIKRKDFKNESDLKDFLKKSETVAYNHYKLTGDDVEMTNCLFVYAAGNDGMDAKYNSGAVHSSYKDYGISSSSRNNKFIVVAAYLANRKLASYSNYGELVDIAAPTEFKAAKDDDLIFDDYYEAGFFSSYGTNHSGAFNGTSAATPVVTGVASLIYSLHPSFTPEEVKDILISSATEKITERTLAKGGTELLAHPIPILNAEAAVKEAKRRIEAQSTSAKTTIIDPTSAKIQLVLTSGTNEFVSATGTIMAGGVPCANEGSFFNQTFSSDARSIVDIPLAESGATCYTISGKAKFKDKAGKVFESAFWTLANVVSTEITMKNQTTLQPLSDVEITVIKGTDVLLGCGGNTCFNNIVKTDTSGKVKLYFETGAYKLYGKKNGYKDSAQEFYVTPLFSSVMTRIQSVESFMTEDTNKQIGSLFGIVRDTDGNVVKNASIRISGGNQTNGFFASATTGESGYYAISNISKTDSNGHKIPYFTLFVSSKGFKPETKNITIVLDGKSRREDFSLTYGEDTSISTVYNTSFEADSSWKLSGQWNNLNQGNTIFNTLVDGGFVTITPDEGNQKAYLPLAKEGNTALWFGQSNTGSFIGQQYSFDSQVSGGTSKQAYSGQATSPLISLVGKQNPELTFWTWWEIESINPNENGFDLMDVQVSIDNGATFTTIKRLNPKIDPNDSGRESKGFSSGGFNRKPVWVQETINLSSYSGSQVRIRFNFDTRDSRYNGFRGWMVDDMKVTALNL